MRRTLIALSVALLAVSLGAVVFALWSSTWRWVGLVSVGALVVVLLGLGSLASRQRERMQTIKRALSRSRIRAQAVIEASPDGIVLLRGTRIAHANPAFRHLLGIPPDEDPTDADLLSAVATEDREMFAEWIHARQAGAHEPMHVEFLALRRSGATLALEASCALVPFEGGRQLALFVRDLSDRRAIAARARHLDRIEVLADAADSFVGEFEKVFWRIRSLCRDGLQGAGDDATRLRECIEGVERAATRGAALSRRVRELAPDPTDPSLHRVLDLTSIVADVVAEFSTTLPGELSVRVIEHPPGPVHVLGDGAQLRQVVWHLLENAAEAQSSGEVRVRVSLRDLDASRAARRPGSREGTYAMVEIRDEGPGMDEEVLARAFTPFFTTKGKRASGLGLPLAFGVVRAHGGFTELDSRPGEGCVARFALPALEEPVSGADAPAKAHAEENRYRGRETLLIVDDDPGALREACHALEPFGYLVEVAPAPREALQRLRHRPAIDLVLLDMVLPGWNGPEVLERILRNWPGQRVLMVSPYPLPEQEETALGAGAVGIHRKPLRTPDLARAVRGALDQPPPASMLTGPVGLE